MALLLERHKLFCLLLPFILVTVLQAMDTREHRYSHPNLRYYDTMSAVQLRHRIVKRDLFPSSHSLSSTQELEFTALGRNFRLVLHKRRGLLHPHFNAVAVDGEGVEQQIDVDEDQFLEGRVYGEKFSEVTAHLVNGRLTATIHTSNESYHVEPSWRHNPDADLDDLIVYRASDVLHSWDDPLLGGNRSRLMDYVKEGDDWPEEEDSDLNYTEDVAEVNRSGRAASRVRRQLDDSSNSKTRCSLLLVADHLFFTQMGRSNYETAVNYLISLIDRVDKVFENTDWGKTGGVDGFSGMGFVIEKILVHTEATPVEGERLHYNMQKNTWDVRDLLEVFSRERMHRDYCLAHLFTERKFDGGVLGLAYVGSHRQQSVGGICTQDYVKNGHALFLNSGLSTSVNHFGNRLITREADLVTAHEFGHNWGSEHDPDRPECSPGASQGGSYLMYTYSVSGHDVNNNVFSPCSVRSILSVLRSKSQLCFTEPEESHCGNQRVEGLEECDAGQHGQNGRDPCCDQKCQLRTGALCSDMNSPCCQHCQYTKANVSCLTSQLAACEEVSRCSGTSASCPKAENKPDKTPCVANGECMGGKCLPYCEVHHKQSCMCDTIEEACTRCCRDLRNGTCESITPVDILADGTPCMHGYCEQGKCVKTVQDVVERFWEIVEDIDLNTFVEVLLDNIVGAVLIVSILIWLPVSCLVGIHDKKKSKKRRSKRHQLSLDLGNEWDE